MHEEIIFELIKMRYTILLPSSLEHAHSIVHLSPLLSLSPAKQVFIIQKSYGLEFSCQTSSLRHPSSAWHACQIVNIGHWKAYNAGRFSLAWKMRSSPSESHSGEIQWNIADFEGQTSFHFSQVSPV